MRYYYHLTSFQNAQLIQKFGFKPGNSGNLGPGIYFAFNPKDTIAKGQCNIKDTIIVVTLDVGRLNTVLRRHSDWTLTSVKNHGYDSVQKLNCTTGPEICIYEPYRVKIVGFVHWDNSNIKFMNIYGNKIPETDFDFLKNGKKSITTILDKYESINNNTNPIERLYLVLRELQIQAIEKRNAC